MHFLYGQSFFPECLSKTNDGKQQNLAPNFIYIRKELSESLPSDPSGVLWSPNRSQCDRRCSAASHIRPSSAQWCHTGDSAWPPPTAQESAYDGAHEKKNRKVDKLHFNMMCEKCFILNHQSLISVIQESPWTFLPDLKTFSRAVPQTVLARIGQQWI